MKHILNVTRIFCLSVMSALLLGCASNPYAGAGKEQSDGLLRAQLQAADRATVAPQPNRIIFAGFAMHSQSKAFRGDVVRAAKWVRDIDPAAIVFTLDNPVIGQQTDWPYATVENVSTVLRKVAEVSRPQDKVVLLFSTHGNAGVLSNNFAGKYYPHINPRWLTSALAPLRETPTLLLLSACHAGSFVQPLRGPSRVILAAAAADRSSFGCNFQSQNTFFVDALLNQPEALERSLIQLMGAAQADIDARERKLGLSPPSLPQSDFGTLTLPWAQQPLKNWINTAGPKPGAR